MSEQNQLSLPYLEITKVAGRTYLRENFTISSRASYKIPLNKIQIREGFNQRTDYDGIEELAESIWFHGLLEPLTLDVLTTGECFVEQGHRRLKAMQLLVSQGKFIEDIPVEFFPNPASTTEEMRMANQYTSNNHQSPLKPIEQAHVAHCLKYNFGEEKSNDEVAKIMGVSRQKVDNLILFAKQPDDVKAHIKSEGLKFTKAVEYIRSLEVAEKKADKAEIEAGQSSMYVVKDSKDVNSEELSDLNKLEKEIALSDENEENNQTEETIQPEGDGYTIKNRTEGEQTLAVSESVITEPVAEREKDKYDESRPEIASIQNIIKLLDKVDNIASKLPDAQASKDICDRVRWMHKDAEIVREWVHKNKKQNKIR